MNVLSYNVRGLGGGEKDGGSPFGSRKKSLCFVYTGIKDEPC